MLPNTLPSIHNRYRMSAELDKLSEFSPEWWRKLLKMYGVECPPGRALRQHVLDAFALDATRVEIAELTGGDRMLFYASLVPRLSRLWRDVYYCPGLGRLCACTRVSSLSRTGAGLVVRALAATIYQPSPVVLGACQRLCDELNNATKGTDPDPYFDDILPPYEWVRQDADHTEPAAGKCSQCAGRGHHLFLFSTPTCKGCGGSGQA